MNKKGQTLLNIGFGIVFFIILVQFIPIVNDETVILRNSTNLDCTNTSISTGIKLTCIVGDLFTPYYFLVGVGVIGMVIAGRKILGQV